MTAKKQYKVYEVTLTRNDQENVVMWMRDYPTRIQTMGEVNGEKLLAFYADPKNVKPNITVKTSVSTSHMPYTSLCVTGHNSVFNPKLVDMRNLGDSSTCRGEYSGTYFACDEYMADAKAEIAKISEQARAHADSYYSQLWV